MSAAGFSLSSPSEAAASKPANERKPKTRPIESAFVPTPEGGLKTLSVKSWLAGVLPPMTLISTTTATMMMSATVRPSIESSTRVATRSRPRSRG